LLLERSLFNTAEANPLEKTLPASSAVLPMPK